MGEDEHQALVVKHFRQYTIRVILIDNSTDTILYTGGFYSLKKSRTENNESLNSFLVTIKKLTSEEKAPPAQVTLINKSGKSLVCELLERTENGVRVKAKGKVYTLELDKLSIESQSLIKRKIPRAESG